jgi:hypothetical protein
MDQPGLMVEDGLLLAVRQFVEERLGVSVLLGGGIYGTVDPPWQRLLPRSFLLGQPRPELHDA